MESTGCGNVEQKVTCYLVLPVPNEHKMLSKQSVLVPRHSSVIHVQQYHVGEISTVAKQSILVTRKSLKTYSLIHVNSFVSSLKGHLFLWAVGW